MKGFLVFNVVAGEANVLAIAGIIASLKNFENEPGHFRVDLTQDEGQTVNYQVQVSNDGAPVAFHIINRNAIYFDIALLSAAAPYIPPTRCTITVERMCA
jgi:hypothetical protein